jgi:putative ABC transport system permease protein
VAGVPIGRRSLFAEKRRAFLGIAGVSVALLLALALDGIFAGATRQLTRYIDTSPADVFVSQRGVRTMHMSSSAVPLSTVEEIRRLRGVAWAQPILYQSSSLTAAGGRQLSYVVGYQPGAAGGPRTIARGTAPGPGEMVVDERAASELRLRIGDTVGSLGRSWRVSGFASGLSNISNTLSFVRLEDFGAATHSAGVASYILVGADSSAPELARGIEVATGLTAQTRARFSAQERRIVRDMSADLMKIMTTAAFLIGLAVVGLTLYAATLARLREIGVMKALGARTRRLAGIVLIQAAWTIGPAVALSVGLAYGLGAVVERVSANVSMTIEPGSILRAAAGAALLGALGAISPLAKVARVDPATVFRRPQ